MIKINLPIIYFSINRLLHKIVNHDCYNFPKLKLTYSNSLFGLAVIPKTKDIKFAAVENEEKQQILAGTNTFLYFVWKITNIYSLIRIVADDFVSIE